MPSTVYETWNSLPISVLIRTSVHRWSAQPWTSGPRSNSRSSLAIWSGPSLGRPGESWNPTPASCGYSPMARFVVPIGAVVLVVATGAKLAGGEYPLLAIVPVTLSTAVGTIWYLRRGSAN